MIAAIQSEYRKFFSTRLWWILMIGMFVYVGAVAGLLGGVYGYAMKVGGGGGGVGGGDPSTGALGSMQSLRLMVYALGPCMAYIFPAIVGALAWTNEYRHRTTVPSFLGEPRRPVVSVAKALAGIPMGLVFGIIGTVAAVGGGAVGLAIEKADVGFSDPQTWKIAGLSVLALTIWAVVGVGLGMLVTSQVGVIITLLVWTQLLEPLALVGFAMFSSTRGIGPYLPGSLSTAIVEDHSIYSLSFAMAGDTAKALPVWEAALLLAGIGVVLGIAGYVFRIRRDIV